MNQNNETVQNGNELLEVINPAVYCETCPRCLQPARGEQLYYDLNESLLEFFCVNPSCIQFDGTVLRKKREWLLRTIRDGRQQLLPVA